MSVEIESVVVVEFRSRIESPRLTVTELQPPPPPPPCWPPCEKTPHPVVPSRAAPTRPVPPIFRKSRRDTRIAPDSPSVRSLSIFMDSPFSSRRLHGAGTQTIIL